MEIPTLSSIILRVLGRYGGPVKAARLIRDVRSVTDTSEGALRGELSKLKGRGQVHQPRYGYYELVAPAPTASIHEPPARRTDASGQRASGEPSRGRAGIVVRFDSGEVWFRIRFPDYMEVETPMDIVIARPGVEHIEANAADN